jgi:hypothetical protein
MVNDDNPPPAKIEPDPPEPEAKATGTALEVQESPPPEPPGAGEPGRSPGLLLVAVFAAALALASVLYFSRERAPAPAKPEAARAAPAPVTIEIPDSKPAPAGAGPHDAPGPVNPSPEKIFNDAASAKETLGAAPEVNRSGEALINALPPAPHAAPGANDALIDAAKNALQNEGGDAPQTDEPEPEASLAPYEARAFAEERAQARRALAFAALAARARTGAPYAAELKAFLAEPQAGPIPALVADRAQTGVPTAAALAADFPAHHRAALASGRRALANGPAAGFGASLASLVNLRPAGPRQGDGPAAVLSRIEAAAMSGDLSRAIAEADALGPEAAAALAPWLDAARVRLAVDAALAERERAFLADLGTGRL